jgi:hypothetical protein
MQMRPMEMTHLVSMNYWEQGKCASKDYRVMGITKHGFERIREAASTTRVLKPHGLTGKEGNKFMDPEVCTALEDHFYKLSSLGEV